MSLNEQVRAMRDPEFRAQLGGFEHPAGQVSEEELKMIAGAGEVTPQTSSWPCLTVNISFNWCPTTACTSQC